MVRKTLRKADTHVARRRDNANVAEAAASSERGDANLLLGANGHFCEFCLN